MRIIDNLIALRILWLLITPFEKTDAFKLGLISADGTRLRKAKTSEETNATSMLHRLVWNIKKFINLVPGGATKIGSMVAAYALVRECVEQDNYTPDLEKISLIVESRCADMPENALELLEILIEDAPVNVTAGASVQEPAIKKKTIAKRFKVSDDTMKKFQPGKQKFRKWSALIDEENSELLEYVNTNPSGILILESDSGAVKLVQHNKLPIDYTNKTPRQIAEIFLAKSDMEVICLAS